MYTITSVALKDAIFLFSVVAQQQQVRAVAILEWARAVRITQPLIMAMPHLDLAAAAVRYIPRLLQLPGVPQGRVV